MRSMSKDLRWIWGVCKNSTPKVVPQSKQSLICGFEKLFLMPFLTGGVAPASTLCSLSLDQLPPLCRAVILHNLPSIPHPCQPKASNPA